MTIIFDMDDDEGTGSGLAPETRPAQVHIEGGEERCVVLSTDDPGQVWKGREGDGPG
jgi:hypothetical protein